MIPLSVQAWPVGIEDCIAPPVEGEEWDMDHRESSGEGSWAARVGALTLTSSPRNHQKEMHHQRVSKTSVRFPFLFLRFYLFPFSRS